MSQYGSVEYWDERYTKDPEPFDWYQRYSGLKDLIAEVVKPDDKILNLGCGNSRLSEDMYDNGYKNITNVDFSKICIKQMQEKYLDRGSSFKFMAMDISELEFADGEFNVVIDKATLDSVLCGEKAALITQKVLSEISRVLKPGGIFFCISYGQPQHREHLLNKPEYGFDVVIQKVFKPTISTSITIANNDRDTPNVHYVYICTKVDN